MILTTQKLQKIDSFMRTKYISSWIYENFAIMEEWRYLMVNTKSLFRTQTNIWDGAFL